MNRVSVVIPVYNSEKYLLDALISVQLQSYKNIEIIVVDDGSTDSSKKIIYDFIKKNKDISIKYIYQENKGPSSARNVGIRSSTGKYIALLDSDDYYHLDKLKHHVNYLIENPHIDLVYGDLTIINHSKEIINIIRADMPSKDPYLFLATLLFRQFIPGPATFVGKKECFINTPYNEDIIFAEDYDFTIRLAMKYKFAYVPEGIYYCRRHDNNLTNNHEAQVGSEIEIVKSLGKEFVWRIIEKTSLNFEEKKFYLLK